MGSSASYQLSKRGLKVLALERFGLGHGFGSSHGRTRIIRLAYYEDDRYVPLLKRAFQSWREAEAETGKTLLKMTGGLMMGDGDGGLVTGVLKSARAHDLAHRMFSREEAMEAFPMFSLAEGACAVYDSNAGVLFPEDCIGAFVSMARARGCEFRFSEAVTGWKGAAGGIEVSTDRDRYLADKMILCAGAWTQGLSGLPLPLECERQAVFWYPPPKLKGYGPEEMPVFISEEKGGSFYYGVPDFGDGVKVAQSHGGTRADPDSVDRGVTSRDRAPVEAFLSRRLAPMKGPELSSMVCLYTNTPDRNFAIGPSPADPRVVVVSACSGHGFKFASVMGEVAADITAGRKPPFDLSFLGLDRFSPGRVSIDAAT